MGLIRREPNYFELKPFQRLEEEYGRAGEERKMVIVQQYKQEMGKLGWRVNIKNLEFWLLTHQNGGVKVRS